MASDKTNVMRVLEQHKIAYKPHEYPHGKDAVDGGRLSCIRYSGRKGA